MGMGKRGRCRKTKYALKRRKREDATPCERGERVGREENANGKMEDEEGVGRHGGTYGGEEVRTEGHWEELPREREK